MSKYKNVRTRGFASKREAARYDELRLLEKAGEIGQLRTQVAYPFDINGVSVCKYVADFVYNDWRAGMGCMIVVEDVKGVRTPIYRLKAKLMRAVYGIEILET